MGTLHHHLLQLNFRQLNLKVAIRAWGDDERSLRPNIATTDENIAKVPQMVLDDHRIKAELAEKGPHLQNKKVLFQQDNATSHTSAVAMAKVHELRIELLIIRLIHQI
ncbi:hypothetical protein TNCV_3275441 [Trichonephila clavipes]|nr:hypothetical protein TNCV_3275441 [Trichonephila clavipes]